MFKLATVVREPREAHASMAKEVVLPRVSEALPRETAGP